MSGTYTRTMMAPQAKDSTIPRFHMEAVEDPIASASAGRPIYRQEERVQIIQPGNPNSPVLRVDEDHKRRWPEYYEAFRKGEEVSIDGTPLEQWPFLKKVNVLELKAKGIFTVEQAASLSDLAVQQLGMGGLSIRENAKAYLDDASAMAIVSEALAAREQAEAKSAYLQRQLDELRPMVDQMHLELMALKNAPSPIETYVPGDHNAITQAERTIPSLPPAPSSLDALAIAHRPRGRPPGRPSVEAPV